MAQGPDVEQKLLHSLIRIHRWHLARPTRLIQPKNWLFIQYIFAEPVASEKSIPWAQRSLPDRAKDCTAAPQ
jgi:hypothetical protein